MKELRILLFAAFLCLVSFSSCSGQDIAATPAQPTQGVTPSMQDSGKNYASQSQSLHVGGTSPYGYGMKRVVYAHHFSFTFSGGENQFDMVTDVNGFVPLDNTALGESDSTCEPGNIKLYGQFTGQGKVDVTGSTTISMGDDTCSCQFTDKVDVQAKGLTHYEDSQYEGRCVDETYISVQLKEVWYKAPKWACSCSDPDNADMAQKMMSAIPATSNPDLEKKTLKFKYLCDGSYLKEDLADPSGMGTGTYQWTWLSGRNETANPPTNPGLLAQDPNQEPIPGCPEGEWGPSLDSIPVPVTTWYPVGGN